MARELKFHRAVERKNGTKPKNSLYLRLDINKWVEKTGGPVEVVIKVRLTFIFFPVCLLQIQQRKGEKEKVVHCSKMSFTPDENDNWRMAGSLHDDADQGCSWTDSLPASCCFR